MTNNELLLEDLEKRIKKTEALLDICYAIHLDALAVTLEDDLDLMVGQAFLLETEVLKEKGLLK